MLRRTRTAVMQRSAADHPVGQPARSPRRWPGRGAVLRAVGREDGAVTFLALGLTMLMVVVSLIAVNATMIVTARVSVQRAADAATLAACLDLPDTSAATATATKYAASSGGFNATTATNLESGKGTQTVTVAFSNDTIPQRGGSAIANSAVRVTVSRTQPLLGVPSVGFGDQTITATAKCARKEGNEPGMIALHPTGVSNKDCSAACTFFVKQATVDLRPASIQACSTSGGIELNAANVTAQHVYTGSGTALLTHTSTLTPAPTLRTTCTTPFDSQAEPPDPTAALTVGDRTASYGGQDLSWFAGCTFGATPTPQNPQKCTAGVPGTPVTIKSGVYWGGLQLGVNNATAANPSTVNLQCGSSDCVFYLAGGGLDVRPFTNVNGDGVVLFIGGYYLPACSSCDVRFTPPRNLSSVTQNCAIAGTSNPMIGIRMENPTHFNVVPPLTGTYADLLLWEGKGGANYTCNGQMLVSGDSNIGVATPGLQGAIYLPTGQFAYLDTGSTTPLTLNVSVFADTIDMKNQTTIKPAYLPSGSVEDGAVHLVE